MRAYLAVTLLAVAACSPTAGAPSPTAVLASVPPAATEAPATPSPTAAAAAPITINGKGISKSAPFELAGNYTVTWTAQSDSSVGCFHGASLERVDGGPLFETLAGEILKDAEPHTGTTNLYNLEATKYYINASSGCTWSFTFTPA